jgi:hypothetical protein
MPGRGIDLPTNQTDKSRRRERHARVAAAVTLVVVLAATAAFALAGCGDGSGSNSCEAASGCFESRQGTDEPVNLSVESLPQRAVRSGSSTAKEIEIHEKACKNGSCLALPPLTVATSIAGTIAEEAQATNDVADSDRSCPLTPTETIGVIPMQMPD